MDNIILNGGGIVAKTLDGRNGLPSDARLSVQYYKDITSIPYPYLYCLIIVREDDPEDTLHPQGIYVITKLNRLGNVDSSGIVPLKEFTEALLKQELQLTDEEKENVISNIFDKTSSSGLKKKYLKSSTILSQSDFSTANTIYVIRYDFDLQNQTINIPENCILEFDGGSLSNGVIVGTNTTLHTDESTAVFDRLILQGSFTNTYLSVRNFGFRSESDSYSTNNGQILTRYIIPSLLNTLCGFYLPKGNYYYNIPIVCNGQFDIVCDGELTYNGENEAVAFTIGNENGNILRKKFVIKLLCGNDQSRYYDKTSESATVPNSYGLKIIHAYSCDIYLNRVMDFAYPVLFYAENLGFCYNNVRVGHIGGKCYTALTLYSTSVGWVNENLFINGRFFSQSSNPFKGEEIAIKMISTGSHTLNQNVFLKPCVEGNHIGIYFGLNTRRNTIIAPRCEGNDISTYYDETSMRNIVISTYDDGQVVNNNFNFNVTTSLFSIADLSVQTIIAEDDVICYNVDGILYSNLVRANEDGIINPGENKNVRYVGYIVDCSEFKNWRIDSDILTRFFVIPLDENNNLEDEGSLSDTIVNTGKGFYYMDGTISGTKKGMLRAGSNVTSRDVVFTDKVKKAFIGVTCRAGDTVPVAKHLYLKAIFYNNSFEKSISVPNKGLLITPYDTTLVPSNPTDAYWNVPAGYRVYNTTTNTFLTYTDLQWIEETTDSTSGVVSASSLGMKEGSENASSNEQILRNFLNNKIEHLYVDKIYHIKGANYLDVDFELHLTGNGGFQFENNGKFLRPLAGSKIVIDGLYFKDGNVISTGPASTKIDYLINGIELNNCTFDGCDRTIMIYGSDIDYSITKFGIKKLIVSNCKFIVSSSQFILSDIVFEDGMYFKGNKVNGEMYSFVQASTNNTYTYTTTNAVNYNGDWIFEGNIVSDSICDTTSYHAMFVAECKKLIVKNNTISNVIGIGDGATYDAYGSAAEYIVENNTYRNICQLPRSGNLYTTTSEIFKSKGNAKKRHIFGNSWYTDFDECREILASRGITFTDDLFNNIAYLTIFAYTSNFEELKFIGNTITLKGGGIKANTANNGKITHSLLSNNVFTVDSVYSAQGATLLPSWGLQETGDVVVTNNIFNFNNQNLPNANTIGIIGTSSYPNTVHPASPNLSVTVTDNKVSGNVSISCDHELKSANIKNNIRIGADVNMSTYTKGATGTVGEFSYIENEQYVENNQDSHSSSRTIRIDSIDNKNCVYNIKTTNNAQIIFTIIPLYANPSKSIDMFVEGGVFDGVYNISNDENGVVLIDKHSTVVNSGTSWSSKLYEDSEVSVKLVANSASCLLYITNSSESVRLFKIGFSDPILNSYGIRTMNTYTKGTTKFNDATGSFEYWNGNSWVKTVDELSNDGGEAMLLLNKGASTATYNGVFNKDDVWGIIYEFQDIVPVGTKFVNNGETPLRLRTVGYVESEQHRINVGETYISEHDIVDITGAGTLGNYSIQVTRYDNLENLLKDVASKDNVDGIYTKSEIDDMLSNVVSPFRETSEDGFFLTDGAGNIVFKYDSNGLDFAMLSEHAKQLIKSANELSYNVVDE